MIFGDSAIREGTVGITSTVKTCQIATNGAQMAVFECTADSTFTCVVEGQIGADGTEIAMPCYQFHSNAFTFRAAGTTITLVSGDLIVVPVFGQITVQVRRAGGTATLRPVAHPDDLSGLMLALNSGGGIAATVNQGTGGSSPWTTYIVDGVGGTQKATVSSNGGLDTYPADGLSQDALNTANWLNGNPAAITNASAHDVIAAQAAGVHIYLTDLIVTNSHASQGTLVTITDGAAGTTLIQGYAAAAGGGFVWSGIKQGTAATALSAICGSSGASVYISASAFGSTH